jgi:hypothetical protein
MMPEGRRAWAVREVIIEARMDAITAGTARARDIKGFPPEGPTLA